MTQSNRLRRLPGARIVAPLALVLLASSCEGGNGWRGLPTGLPGGGNDTAAPTVDIRKPSADHRVAVQDSVFIEVHLRDDVGVDSVIFSGFAERGDRSLGTDTIVQRFVPKRVSLRGERTNRDTTLTRHLLPTADSIAEDRVFLVVTARDSVGNVRADTVQVSIGGPRVQIVEPARDSEVRAGTRLRVRVVASDSADPLRAITLRLRPAGSTTTVVKDTTIEFNPPRARVDTVLQWTIPGNAPAASSIEAVARTAARDSAVTIATPLRVLGAAADERPPTVTFTTSSRTRVELGDTLFVRILATDSSGVDSVGVSIVARNLLPGRTETIGKRRRVLDDSVTIAVPMELFEFSQPTDTSTVELSINAFAYDAAPVPNCGVVDVPNTPLDDPCEKRDGGEFAPDPGPPIKLLLVRGTTARSPSGSDRLVDLAADSVGRRVFVSNFFRNRVETLDFGSTSFGRSIDVGSRPWGLAIGINLDTLYVANSAGTNISVVPLATLTEAEQRRIGPPDLQLWSFTYDVDSDSINSYDDHDYSDRPQFIGQSRAGHIIYSTVPTAVEGAGTIRIIDPAKDQTNQFGVGSEIFTRYAEFSPGNGIVVNALSVEVFTNRQMRVCPRRLRASQGAHPGCVTGTARSVTGQLAALENAGLTDTRIDIDSDIESIALTDTTFVAVSGDHSFIAFGEGGVDPGRVLLFEALTSGDLEGTTRETGDLLGNAAERVTSLALNGDGSLGVARGRLAYFFDSDLRLEGQAETGSSSNAGGVALHPLEVDYPSTASRRRAFVSGIADGVPYIDIIDSFSFRTLRRILIRDQIIGPLVATAVVPGDVDADKFQLRLFGITAAGVVQVGVTAADLSGGASVRAR